MRTRDRITREIKEENKEVSSSEVKTTVPPTDKHGKIVNAFNVRVRKDPNFDAEVLEVLRKGDKVKILGKVKDFYKVSTRKNKIAYISSPFIKEV